MTEHEMMHAPEALRFRFWRSRTSEERLLLCCTRQKFTYPWLLRAMKIAVEEAVCWEKVLAIAVLHQVTPLIYRNLKSHTRLAERVPGIVLEKFRQSVLLNMQKKGGLAGARRDALAWFEDLDVDVLLVKGTSLDVVLYEEPWLTVSQDIDLVLDADWDSLDEDARDRIRRMNRGRPLIDVHCRQHPDLVMNGLLPLDFARILAGAQRSEVHGHPVLLMSREDELLCACIQSFRKRFFRLKSLCEIAELVDRNPTLDWDRLARNARRERCGGIVYVALRAAQLAVSCRLPSDLRSRLGVSRLKASFLHGLITRLSFSSLETLYVNRWVRSKMLGRGLVLPYASLGWRELRQSLRIVFAQTLAEEPRHATATSEAAPPTSCRA